MYGSSPILEEIDHQPNLTRKLRVAIIVRALRIDHAREVTDRMRDRGGGGGKGDAGGRKGRRRDGGILLSILLT